MGQCGCGDFCASKGERIGEHVIVFEEYDGCRDCGTPIGVVVNLFTPEEAEHWGVEVTGEFKPDEHGWEYRAIRLIGQEELVKAARVLEKRDGIRLRDYRTLSDILQDYGLELLQEALVQRDS